MCDDQVFRLWLKSQGFKVVEMPADGNCFFWAIAKLRGGNDPMLIRLEVAQYVYDHLEDYEIAIHFTGLTPFQRIVKIVNLAYSPKEWADGLCVIVVQKLYNINLNVFLPPNCVVRVPSVNICGLDTFNLSYHNSCHYNLLRSTKNEDEESEIVKTVKANIHESSKHYKIGPLLTLNVYFVIFDVCKADNLLQALILSKTKEIYVLVDGNHQFRDRLLGDRDLRKRALVFECAYDIPEEMGNEENWFCVYRLMLSIFILSSVRAKWIDFTFKPLVFPSETSLMLHLLDRLWGTLRIPVTRDILYIGRNLSSWCCLDCKMDCPVRYEPWHLHFDKFAKVDFHETSGNKFMEKFSFFDNKSLYEKNILGIMRAYYCNNNRNVMIVLKQLYENYLQKQK